MNILHPKDYMANQIDETLIEKIRLYALTALSMERYEHSLRVAKLSKELCQKYNEDETLGYLAGLSHDICKEMDKKHLEKTVMANGGKLTKTEEKKPSLLHGKACAILLQKQFAIHNRDILEAVEYHTFGKKNMSNIAKIVCVADKIEPERPYMSSSKKKNLLKLNLDDLLSAVLTEIIDVRKKKKEDVFPEALWVLD